MLRPWGSTSEPVEDDVAEHRDLAQDTEQRIREVRGRTYVAQQASESYPTAGDTTDWTYGEYDAVSFTAELRPASWTRPLDRQRRYRRRGGVRLRRVAVGALS